jgi:hypothetical protein
MLGGEGGSPVATVTPRWTSQESGLLAEWGRRAKAAQHAHYLLASQLRRRNLWLGIPTVIISAIVGTSLFATMSQEEALPVPLRIIVGMLSVAVAVLAALQTFLRFAERAERHVAAGDWFASIAREVEELLALSPDRRENSKDVLDRIRKEMNKASQSYPPIGEKVWHTAAKAHGVTQPAFRDESKISVP